MNSLVAGSVVLGLLSTGYLWWTGGADDVASAPSGIAAEKSSAEELPMSNVAPLMHASWDAEVDEICATKVYLAERATERTPDGVLSFAPGTEVEVLASASDQVLVAAEGQSLYVSDAHLTQDADKVRELRAAHPRLSQGIINSQSAPVDPPFQSITRPKPDRAAHLRAKIENLEWRIRSEDDRLSRITGYTTNSLTSCSDRPISHGAKHAMVVGKQRIDRWNGQIAECRAELASLPPPPAPVAERGPGFFKRIQTGWGKLLAHLS